MKFLAFALLGLNLLSNAALAQTALDLAGFEVKSNNLKLMKLNYGDESEYIISKEKFKDAESAKKFCSTQGSTLSSVDGLFLLAMSGAMNSDRFLEKAFAFKISNKGEVATGLWTWDASGDVLSVIDGDGGAVVRAPINEIGKMFKVRIPALCVKSLK